MTFESYMSTTIEILGKSSLLRKPSFQVAKILLKLRVYMRGHCSSHLSYQNLEDWGRVPECEASLGYIVNSRPAWIITCIRKTKQAGHGGDCLEQSAWEAEAGGWIPVWVSAVWSTQQVLDQSRFSRTASNINKQINIYMYIYIIPIIYYINIYTKNIKT